MEIEGKITIPVTAGGVLIGKGGATIRAIADESGAKLVVRFAKKYIYIY